MTSNVDRYIALMAAEKAAKAEYDVIKSERVALMEELASEMDAQSVSAYYGSDGSRVTTVHKTYGSVADAAAFRAWCIQHRCFDQYWKEVTIQSEVGEVVRESLRGGHLIPPGLESVSKTELRILKPKDGNGGFKQAAGTVLERLRNARMELDT